MSDQLSLFDACWCIASDLWGGGRLCATARKLEAGDESLDHTNALRVAATGSVCDSCGKTHFDGAWLICDDCDDSLLRAWLKWSVEFKTAALIVHALAAKRLLEVAS